MLASLTSSFRRRKRQDLVAETLVEVSRERRKRAPADRDFVASLVLGAGFALVAGLMAVLLPHQHQASPLLWVAFVCVYAALARVEFEVGSGCGVPTQLVLVPMLF